MVKNNLKGLKVHVYDTCRYPVNATMAQALSNQPLSPPPPPPPSHARNNIDCAKQEANSGVAFNCLTQTHNIYSGL